MNKPSDESDQTGASTDFNPTPVELLLKDSSAAGDSPVTLPGGFVERRRLDHTPDELLISKEFECGGWSTTLRLNRGNLRAVYEFVYESDEADLPGVAGNPDDVVELIGFWD